MPELKNVTGSNFHPDVTLDTELQAHVSSSNPHNVTAAQTLAVAVSSIGIANGICPLDAAIKIDSAYLPGSILGGLSFQGLWDASTGSPPSLVPTNGQYWIVDVAGNTNLDGIVVWGIGDWALYDGGTSTWRKIDQSNAVVSVNGYTGVVVLNSADTGSLAITNNLSDLNNNATARTNLGIGSVENTALSTWVGTTNITTLGTIATGVWNGSPITDAYISSSSTWSAASILAQSALQLEEFPNQDGILVRITDDTGSEFGVAAIESDGLNGLTVSNGNGVDGNPTISLADATTIAGGALSSTFWNLLNNSTYAKTGSTLMFRDAAGRSRVQTPSIGDDIANKSYVDSTIIGGICGIGHNGLSELQGGDDSQTIPEFYHLSYDDYLDIMNGGLHDNEFNGCVIEKQDTTVVVDTGVIYLDVEKLGGGDLTLQVDGEHYYLDCITGSGVGGKARIALTAGTATTPQDNYVTLNRSGSVAVLSVSTSFPDLAGLDAGSGFVAYLSLWSAAKTVTDGALRHQRTTDAVVYSNRGRIGAIMERLRSFGATWLNGANPTAVIVPNGGAPDSFDLLSAAGVIYQAHQQTWPSLSVLVNGCYVMNASGTGVLTKWQKITNCNQLLELADGTAITINKRFNLTFFGLINKTTGECKIGVNLPTGTYTSNKDGYNDPNNTAVVSVPDTVKTVAFLLCRVPIKYSTLASGTWSFLGTLLGGVPDVIDLRGNPIGISGSGASGSASTFPDDVFEIFDNTDTSKRLALDASAISTATTRTLVLPNKNGTITLAGDNLVVDAVSGTGLRDQILVGSVVSTNDAAHVLQAGVITALGESLFLEATDISNNSAISADVGALKVNNISLGTNGNAFLASANNITGNNVYGMKINLIDGSTAYGININNIFGSAGQPSLLRVGTVKADGASNDVEAISIENVTSDGGDAYFVKIDNITASAGTAYACHFPSGSVGHFGGTIETAIGARIDEFSTDGTMSGNSDTAVPTEQAVKTYVDNLDANDISFDGGTLTSLVADNVEDAIIELENMSNHYHTEAFIAAASDETTDLTTGTAKVTFRMPYAFTLTGVKASVSTAPTHSSVALTVDVKETGTTILSAPISFVSASKTATGSIADASLASDSEITVDIGSVGDTTPGKGLKITLIGHQ